MLKKFLFFSVLTIFIQGYSQSISCQLPLLKDNRDFLNEIPGVTTGQKLESLLFWTQQERDRRFPMMQTIFPSSPVKAGNTIFPLRKDKKLLFQGKEKTLLKEYIDENHIAGVIVLQEGKIKLEAYGKGVDSKTLWTSFSVAKSVSSMLVGVALKNGDLQSMDDELQKYIPEFRGDDYGKVTIRQLLTMTSGIAWNEDYTNPESDVAKMYRNPCVNKEAHILTYMKNLKQEYAPGTHWNYSTGETDLVGILLQKATGKNLAAYLSEKIWIPFGMQQCAYWLEDECSSMNIGGSGLSASLRDFSRLGLLMLNNGNINGNSIFSEDWLHGASSSLFKTSDKDGGYGYLWWRDVDGSFAAFGIFGQMIYINPKKNVVIAQIAAWPQATSKALSTKRRDFISTVLKQL